LAKPRTNRLIRWRGLVQLLFAAASNSFVTGFLAGKIYQGDLKKLCAPGLNCYSCPGALLSCPIGSLQAVLTSRAFSITLYVTGLLLVFGATMGRFVCGFLCPFGMIQEWLYRIPFPWKKKTFRGDKPLRRLKYLLLVVLVIALPTLVKDAAGSGSPTFCKYVCPAGTLEAAIPLVLLNPGGPGVSAPPPVALPGIPGLPALPELRIEIASSQPVYETGPLFTWKMLILVAVVLLSVMVWRPFCRYLCPLGAIYGLMNPVSLYRLRMEQDLCIHCGKCNRSCKMALEPERRQNEAECVRCGDCVKACPTGALTMGFTQRKPRAAEPGLPLEPTDPQAKGRNL
jgi:ferredoxin-type protein NapH